MTNQTKVIVKREKQKNPTGTNLLLFFPEEAANAPNIVCWDGAHCEASMGYFWNLKNPDDAEADNLIKAYESIHDVSLARIKRDSQKMRVERWRKEA